MKECGFYIVSDDYFKVFPDPYLKGNKEERRPHYYALFDKDTQLYWMIPMSSRIEKYASIINAREKSNRPCDILHIAKLDNGQKSAFLIQDIFPVSKDFIEREYTIADNHLRVTSEHLAKTINQKAKNVLMLTRKGVKLNPTQPDVLKIEQILKDKTAESFVEGINSIK